MKTPPSIERKGNTITRKNPRAVNAFDLGARAYFYQRLEELSLTKSKVYAYLHTTTSRRYPMTREIKLKQHKEQDGRCSLCGRPLKLKEAIQDHDHATNLVRGLLHAERNGVIVPFEFNDWRIVDTPKHGSQT